MSSEEKQVLRGNKIAPKGNKKSRQVLCVHNKCLFVSTLAIVAMDFLSNTRTYIWNNAYIFVTRKRFVCHNVKRLCLLASIPEGVVMYLDNLIYTSMRVIALSI